jgi:Abnormal spindle-like microcephaly-assoc'd, ASPM-SPD-2-Hydin
LKNSPTSTLKWLSRREKKKLSPGRVSPAVKKGIFNLSAEGRSEFFRRSKGLSSATLCTLVSNATWECTPETFSFVARTVKTADMSSLSPSALGRLVPMSITIAVFLMSTASIAFSTQTRILTISNSNIWYGGVPMGQSASHTVTLTNTGSAGLTISKETQTDSNFKSSLSVPLTLAAGQSTQFVVTFTPSFVGHINAAFIFTSNATAGRLVLGVHGGGVKGTATAGSLAPSPASLNFSGVQMGSSQTLPETLTNSGNASVTVSSTKVQGNSQFTLTAPGLPLTLAAGHSMTLNVTFTPTGASTATGSISVASSVPSLSIPLSGTTGATGTLSVTPGALSFGKVTVGSSTTQTGSLSASGASVVVSGASVNSNEFSMTGLSFPFTIAAGKSVPFTATFTPQNTGAASANFTFTGNSSQASESLSGTGMAAASYSVGLSWQASTSNVEGYNVYRGGASSGPFSKLTSSLDAATAYTDSTVQSGSTYFYVTTAVGTDGVESAYSNQVEAVIP